jgi:hypothetical protein
LRTSENKRFTIYFNHEDDNFHSESQESISGNVFLKEGDKLLWIKNFDMSINAAAVSDNGTVALLLYTPHLDSSKFISPTKPKDFVDLGSILAAFEKDGKQIFTYEFGSNIEGCDISSDGKLVSVSTLFPDNSIYCFDLQNKLLLWKYKNHSKKGVLKLYFNNNKNNLEVFTGNSVSTAEKEYVMELDGSLEQSYAEYINTLSKIKKQAPEQKVESLITMINSGNRDKTLEAIGQLKTFVTTKGSFPDYSRIIDTLSKFIQTEDVGIFDNIWIVLKAIMKNQPQIIEPLIPKILSRFKKSTNYPTTLRYLGDLGAVNPEWIINELPLIKQKFFTSKHWDERTSAAFAIGSIGSVDVDLVNEMIPVMVDYVSNPDKVRKELDDLRKKDLLISSDFITVTSINTTDYTTLLRDACIDTIRKIGRRYPESVKIAIPVLERLSNYALSPYTNKKAKKAIEEINKKKQNS